VARYRSRGPERHSAAKAALVAQRCSTRTGGIYCAYEKALAGAGAVTSTIWWLVPSACWKRTKLRSPPRTSLSPPAVDDIRISMRPQYRLVRLLAPRVLTNLCAVWRSRSGESTGFAGPILLFRAVSQRLS